MNLTGRSVATAQPGLLPRDGSRRAGTDRPRRLAPRAVRRAVRAIGAVPQVAAPPESRPVHAFGAEARGLLGRRPCQPQLRAVRCWASVDRGGGITGRGPARDRPPSDRLRRVTFGP